MAGRLSPVPRLVFADANGAPYNAGKLYTYTAGTNDLVSTFTDAALAVANANPVILDSRGSCVVFLTPGVSYKFKLDTSADVTVFTQDNIAAADLAAEIDFGGSLNLYEDTLAADTYGDLPDSWDKEIDGEAAGLSVHFEINCRAQDATVVTITCRLFNITANAAVTGSEVAVVNPGNTRTRGVTVAQFSLATGTNRYKAQIKRSVNTTGVAARARVYT